MSRSSDRRTWLCTTRNLVPRYRERVRGMAPWRIQQYIWSVCYRSKDADQLLLDCDAPVSEAESLAVIELYRESPKFTEDLRFWMGNLNSGLQLMQGIQAEARALSDDVERELGR